MPAHVRLPKPPLTDTRDVQEMGGGKNKRAWLQARRREDFARNFRCDASVPRRARMHACLGRLRCCSVGMCANPSHHRHTRAAHPTPPRTPPGMQQMGMPPPLPTAYGPFGATPPKRSAPEETLRHHDWARAPSKRHQEATSVEAVGVHSAEGRPRGSMSAFGGGSRANSCAAGTRKSDIAKGEIIKPSNRMGSTTKLPYWSKRQSH